MTQLRRRRPADQETQDLDPNRGFSVTPAPTHRTKHLPIPDDVWRDRVVEARAMAYCGASIDEIAAWFGVSTSNFYNWGTKCPDLLDAIAELSPYSDDRVERSLYVQALEGNTTAAIFWLKNRRANKWRDKRDIDLNADVTTRGETNYQHLAMGMIALMHEASNEQSTIEGELSHETEHQRPLESASAGESVYAGYHSGDSRGADQDSDAGGDEPQEPLRRRPRRQQRPLDSSDDFIS